LARRFAYKSLKSKFSRRLRRLKSWRLAALGIISGGLITLVLVHQDFRRHISDLSYDTALYILSFIEKPFNDYQGFKQNLDRHLYIQKNVKVLEEILSERRALLHKVRSLEFENDEMRELLHLQKDESGLMTVGCFGHYSDLASRSLFIKAGRKHGIKRYDVVLYEDSIVGQINRVSDRYAEVLLINDLNSKLPVSIEGCPQEGIVTGNPSGQNSARLKLLYFHHPEQVKVGARVYSSGCDGFFPRGKFIGYVETVDPSGVYIKPVLDFNSINYVQIYSGLGDHSPANRE
jgi:Cell shape-determining protein